MIMNSDNLREYPVVDGATVHDPDDLNKVKHVIQAAKEDTEIFPALNNYNPHTQSWDTGVGDVLKDPDKRAALRCSRSCAFSPHIRSIAAFRSTLKASPTTPIPPT